MESCCMASAIRSSSLSWCKDNQVNRQELVSVVFSCLPFKRQPGQPSGTRVQHKPGHINWKPAQKLENFIYSLGHSKKIWKSSEDNLVTSTDSLADNLWKGCWPSWTSEQIGWPRWTQGGQADQGWRPTSRLCQVPNKLILPFPSTTLKWTIVFDEKFSQKMT